ncbi:hypothetical protein [Streptomyces sp. NPDC086777]|uniref:hypothetical protein n=1 Tax=Streptomyces sp. NPDC086777 TaxID=3154866 RepID=UPI00344EF22E
MAHRPALDHARAVSARAVLDIVRTRHAYRHADADLGCGYYHWFFLTAGNGIPEHLIGGDPEFWIRARTGARHHGGTPFDPDAQAEYVRCFSEEFPHPVVLPRPVPEPTPTIGSVNCQVP